MKDKKLKEKLYRQKIIDIAWNNFCESGEIGAYLFYRRLQQGDNIARLHTKRRGIKGD
ncbi:MAG: hypothetical protein IJU58_03660 [Clostridia bacterium]|nr:hypothetical protein [Clostridia bacterium]